MLNKVTQLACSILIGRIRKTRKKESEHVCVHVKEIQREANGKCKLVCIQMRARFQFRRIIIILNDSNVLPRIYLHCAAKQEEKPNCIETLNTAQIINS